MTMHEICVEKEAVHGSFDRTRPPILTVDSGDTVIYETLDASWGRAGRDTFGETLPGFEMPEEEKGHALSGPVAVRGAEPGDVLEVRIGEVRPGSWGWTWAGPRPWLPRYELDVTEEVSIAWDIDRVNRVATARDRGGLAVPIRPFMGVMGNAPAAEGRHDTAPPRRVGGNLDCRELVTGSTLWLPIEVEGALFSVGDGHAVQGDGEVGQTAIECPMERVELTFTVRKDMKIDTPHASTPIGSLTLGLGATVDDATQAALAAMLDHMQSTYGLSRAEALALSSLVVDLRITQIVNGTVGVHAVLPPAALASRLALAR
jgi:acetamidase/formamidase